jgi:hypothetical protein
VTTIIKKRRGEEAWSTMLRMGRNSAGLLGIELTQDVEDAGSQRAGRQGGADDELHPGRAFLGHGEIHLPVWRIFGVAIVHVCDDADDLAIRSVGVDNLAERVLAGKQETGDGFVEDDDSWAHRPFVPGKVAPPQAHTHGMEVAGSDHIDQGIWEIVAINA